MGLLDILMGNNGANLPYGMLYQQPGNPAADPQTALDAAGLGIPQSAIVPSPFGDPSKLSVAAPSSFDVPKPNDIWSNAAPFSLAGSGPATQWPPAPPAAAAAAPAAPAAPAPATPTPAPQPPATDLSSVNRPAAAPQSDQAQPIAIGNYQMPRIGEADDFEPDDDADELPANAKPTSMTGSPGAPAATTPAAASPAPFSLAGASDRLGLAGRGFLGNMAAGPIGAIAGGLGALITGKPTDAASIANQGKTATARALLAKGASLSDVQAAVNSPELTKALIDQYYGKDHWKVVQVGEDGMGNKRFMQQNSDDGSLRPIPGTTGAGSSGGGIGDMSKTGAEYLATVPPQQAQIIKGMVDGTIQPPSSFALAKPAWQAMLAGAKNVDPNFDANTWAARHKMVTDLSASGNSSMGGILANGKSSFAHLADLSGSMVALGNASHDFPGGAAAAYLQNRVGNAMGGSDTAAKIKAINDNLGHYGQESTKFYSGTGGGAEERMNALKEMNPNSTSSEEMAAYLEKEKSLMTDRLREKEAQIRSTMGDAYLQRHPVFTPELQQTMNTIDTNIAKLRGQAVPAAPTSAAPAVVPAGKYVWTPNGGLVGAK